MFDANSDNEKKFPQFPTQPTIQRSVSAPAIAEHVSDAILPTFNLEGEDAVGLHVPYYSSNPNRLNPRLPGAKRSDHEENELKSLLDESAAGWNAIMGDPTRIDLIQPDFPPSGSLYGGNHGLSLQVDANGSAEPPRLSPMVPAQMPALISNAAISDDGLDQATKSMSKLYVNSELSPKGGASTQTPTPMLAQYHTPLNSAAAPFFQPPKSPVGGATANLNGASINSIIGNGDFGMKAADNNGGSFGAQGGMGVNTTNTTGFLSGDANVFNYNPQGANQNGGFGGMLGGKANAANATGQGAYQVIPPQGTNNVYPQQMGGQMPQLMVQQPMAMQGNPQQTQGGFFMQPQQMFMNNGQPMFIRNGVVNQFSQEYMYNMDGSMQMQNPTTGMMTDPSQMQQQQMQQQFMQQQYGNVQNMNGGIQQQQQQQFWNGATPEQGMNPQAPVFVANNQAQQNGIRMNMQNMEEPMRIMFNSNVSFGNQAAVAMQQGPNNAQGMNRGNMNQQQSQQQMMGGMQFPMNNNQSMMPGMSANGNNNGGMMNTGMMGRMDGMQGMGGYQGNMGGMGPDDGSGMMNNGMMNNGNNNNGNHRNGGYDDYGNNMNNNGGMMNNNGHRDRRDYNNNNHHNDRNGYRDRHNNHGHHNNVDGGHMGGRHGRDQNNNMNGNMNNNMGPKDKMHRNNGNGNNNNNASGGNFHGAHAPRDALVDEFRSSFGKPGRTWTLKELTSHIVAFCQDQHGSRFIQQRLEVCTESEKQLVFDEVLPSAHILMTDVFGNYVLQKLFEYGVEDQCESLASILKGQAVALSMQMYGCRVVQKALEYVSRDRLVELVKEFEAPQALIECVHDSNGNHVIQKCIEVVSKAARAAENPEMEQYLSGRIQFIIDQFKGRVKELSSHPYGCRVVQRILEHCTASQKDVILEELRACCGELVQDCYGNYVIQFVMQHGCEADQIILMTNVMDNLLEYSQHKFASNVVEKCLQFASHKDRNDMIWKIINATFDLANPVDNKGHCFLETMVRDPYANYVVQKVIEVSDERQRGAIMRYVKDNITQLRKYTYGKHIIICLEKLTNEKF